MITIASLVYRNVGYLRWMLEGIQSARTDLDWKTLIIANGATDEALAAGIHDIALWPDPAEHYLAGVYRAWNTAVQLAETEWVVLINSDMYVSDWWLDELWDARNDGLPTSLLVESGRIPSALPQYVCDYGKTPHDFDRCGFSKAADRIRRLGAVTQGSLYMPVLFRRSQFMELGSYPEGNPPGTTGDKDLFSRYAQAGIKHVMCLGSVVYHVQEGEMRA